MAWRVIIFTSYIPIIEVFIDFPSCFMTIYVNSFVQCEKHWCSMHATIKNCDCLRQLQHARGCCRLFNEKQCRVARAPRRCFSRLPKVADNFALTTPFKLFWFHNSALQCVPLNNPPCKLSLQELFSHLQLVAATNRLVFYIKFLSKL